MSTPQPIPLLLLGVGYIGGSLLSSLLASKKYAITALVRGEDKAEVLRSLGVTPLVGTLDDEDVLFDATLLNDVIINTASVDAQTPVKAILRGLAARPASRPPAVFIHTSGTGLLTDSGEGVLAATHVFSDKRPEEIDALPDTAVHRHVDLLLRHAVLNDQVGTARLAVLLPPVIYGIGTGPFNKLSIALPLLTEQAVEDKTLTVVGKGVGIWDHIHISNLVLAYEKILEHLTTTPPPHPLYFFAETGHHSWLSFTQAIQQVLVKKGLVSDEITFDPIPSFLGTNARSSADVLRELGWQPKVTVSFLDSVEQEVEEVLKGI